MPSTDQLVEPGGFALKFHWRILGTPSPVFPGFEVDISDRVGDEEKPDAVWHRERARGLLQDHPEIRQLFGHTPSTAAWCMACFAAQIGLALALMHQPWWAVLACAYVFGAWLNICLFQLGHDCNHGLVFDNKKWDRAMFTLTTLPMFMPGHHTWWIEHHVHHNDLGAKKDFVKRRRSILLLMKDRIAGYVVPQRIRWAVSWATTPLFWPISLFMLITQILRAVIGLTYYFLMIPFRGRLAPNDTAVKILADEHLLSGYDRYRMRSWAVIYPLLQISLLAALFFLGGWKTLSYMLLSSLFVMGYLHPLLFGMMLSNSHFHGHKNYQPTSSYYGWLNWLSFNFGLHTEHHDLAAVPWCRLGKLRQIAPEYYDNLPETRSYAGLALQFAFGSRERFNSEDYRNHDMFSKRPQPTEPALEKMASKTS